MFDLNFKHSEIIICCITKNKDKSEDDKNADKSENTEEIFEDEVNENDMKNKNVEESLEPVEVDKTG